LRCQDPRTEANGRKPTTEWEDLKPLAPEALGGNGLRLLGFLKAGLKTPTLSAATNLALLVVAHRVLAAGLTRLA